MKTSFLGTPHAFRYLPGDSLLETDRLADLSLRPLDGPVQPGKDDDLPTLRGVLKALKFTPDETKALIEGFQSTVNIVGGIVSVVGTVTSVVDLMGKLGVFGPKEDATQAKLNQIGTRLNQIYNYLVAKETKGLYVQAGKWRSALLNARTVLNDVQTNPIRDNIRTLVDRTEALDSALSEMLDPINANISFLQTVYHYDSSQFHWIDAAFPPFMTRTDGVPINYADPEQELGGSIWDAGHYIDVLFSSLKERMLITVTIEPAFRSTAFHRSQFKVLVTKLTEFINAWRGAMLVASPAAGLSGGYPNLFFGWPSIGAAPGTGLLQNPYRPHLIGTQSAPMGIVLGAVDPVTGLAAWEPEWDGFEIVGTVTLDFGEAWGGGYDYTRAKDPPKALAAAMQRQAQLLDEVIVASGIGALVQLRAQLQLAASEVIGSEFVQLPNASFRRVKTGITIDGSPTFALRKGEVESVDLGRLSSFAQNPEKKYKGKRYFQESEKTFRFRMAQRTSWNLIQLGYRLRIGGTDIPLVPFSRAGFLDRDVTLFPTETIVVEVREAAFVYNVRQSHVFSFAEEDLFEAGKPIPVTASRWLIPGWRGRLFLDERIGKIAFAVEVRFEHDPTGQHYTGEAIVTIRNLDPERFPDGVILPVQVFETHMNGDNTPKPQEYLADNMTVHLVPSFLVMSPDYFAAYWEAFGLMLNTIKQLDDRFGLEQEVPRRPNPDPAWAVRRQVLETNAMVDAIDAIRSKEPETVAEVIQQFRPPAVRK